MSSWDRARVLALAPDAGARTAAIGLASASSWSDVGSAGPMVWGRCQGSGRTPYFTAVVLDDPPAYSCTCPSRKFPCKHALALLLRWSTGGCPSGRAAAVRGGVAQRRPTGPRQSLAAGLRASWPTPRRPAKRAAARAERVPAVSTSWTAGCSDQIRGGLAGLERAGYAPFEPIAARMVDAQAPGVAGPAAGVAGRDRRGSGWPGRLLDQLGLLHLLVAGAPAARPAAAGAGADRPLPGRLSRGQGRRARRPGVADHWLALGMVETVEYRLETRRVWLYGATTRRWALLLSFAPPGGDPDVGGGRR